MDTGLRTLIDRIDTARDEYMLVAALKGFGSVYGCTRFAFSHIEGAELKTYTNYPSAWQKAYAERRYCLVDPVVTEAKRRMQPFCWSLDDWKRRSVGRELTDFRDQAIRYGIRAGVTMPVEGSFGSTLTLTFASPAALPLLAAPIIHPVRAAMAVQALRYRLDTLDKGLSTAPKQRLSPREMMCLTWATKGKYTHEIAELSNIDTRTVQHYLDSARRKFEAVTVPQLVAIAKDHGLI